VKHPDLPDLPLARDGGHGQQEEGPVESLEHRHLEHSHDIDQPEVLDIYRRWRGIAEEHDALLLGEVYLLEAERMRRYVEGGDGLHLAFWFTPLHHGWEPDALRRALSDGSALPPGTLGWVLGSHDRMRAPSRYGGGERGRARALAIATLLMGMPGIPFVYQGEELALTDGEVPPERAQDPWGKHDGALDRDGCRTPMLWEPDPGWGFTTATAEPWLPFGDRRPEDTVAAQREDEASPLHRYRALIAWRRATPALFDAEVQWLTEDGPLIAYRTGDHVVIACCGTGPAELALPEGEWRVVFATDRAREGETVRGSVDLEELEAVVLSRPRQT
jgi:alpha-glucosidase